MSKLNESRREDHEAVNPNAETQINQAEQLRSVALPALEPKADNNLLAEARDGFMSPLPQEALGKPQNQPDPIAVGGIIVEDNGIDDIGIDSRWALVGADRIEGDYERFREIVKGKVRDNLKKYISNGEMIGKQGKDLVSIPIPQIDPPRFKFGNKGNGGVGAGEGEVGDSLGGEPQEGEGDGTKPGEGAGKHQLEVEMTLDELTTLLGEQLGLPRIQPKGKNNVEDEKNKYNDIRKVGPESLRHMKRTYREALKRHISAGEYDPDDPKVVPIREDKRYRSPETVQMPNANAVIIYMMDVSGSMTDEQKTIVRLESFWLDSWISKHYKNVEKVYIIHDAEARVVDEHTFYHTRESGGTKISAAYELANRLTDPAAEPIEDQKCYNPNDWNIYAFHFSDGDNWGDDDGKAISLVRDQFLPKFNLFGYGQVESPYGSGEFIKSLKQIGEIDNMVLSRIPNREGIINSIRDFLVKGK